MTNQFKNRNGKMGIKSISANKSFIALASYFSIQESEMAFKQVMNKTHKCCAMVVVGAALYATPAVAVIVDVNGELYDVTTVVTQADASQALLIAQPWWGDISAARSAAIEVGAAFGRPNYMGYGPLFAYAVPEPERILGLTWDVSTDGTIVLDAPAYQDVTYAVAAKVVPVPAAVWLFGSGLLGLVGMARRKKA